MGRGLSDMAVDANSGLVVVRWLDNSAVQLSSTHAAVEQVTTVQRWDRKEHKHVQVNCPAIVKEYNEHMGGVDVFDMLMSLYQVDHKSTKWYRRIFFWALNVAIINGWLLYRRHCQQLQQPIHIQQDLVEFTAAVSEALIHQNKLPPVVVSKRGHLLSSSTNLEPVSEEEQLPESKKRLVSVPARDVVCFDNIGHLPSSYTL